MQRRAVPLAVRQYATKASKEAASNEAKTTTKAKGGRKKAASKTEAEVTSLASFQSAFIDETRLPFVKYVVGETTFRRFQEKKATTEERKKVFEALQGFLPRRTTQIAALDAARAILDAQSVVSMLRSPKPDTPAEVLERLKPDVLGYFGIEESQFEQVAKEVLKGVGKEGGQEG